MTKNRRIIIIVLASLIAVLTVGSVVTAVVWQNQKKETVSEPYYVVEQAQRPQLSNKNLTYVKSLTQATGRVIHFFEDDLGNEYTYDDSGMLVGQSPVESETHLKGENTPLSAEEPVTEDEAAEIAFGYAKEIYGEKYIQSFKLEKSTYHENKEYFVVRYGRAIGRYVLEYFDAIVNEDGTMKDISMSDSGQFEGLDIALIQNLDDTAVDAYVDNYVKESVGENLAAYEVQGRYVKHKDGEYYIAIGVGIDSYTDIGDPDSVISSTSIIEYPIGSGK